MTIFMSIVGLLLAAPAVAEPTMAVWVDAGSGLERVHAPEPAVPFSVVITLDSAGETVAAVEFAIPEVHIAYPGILKTGSSYLFGTDPVACGLDGCLLGPTYYSFPAGGCEAAGESIELARLEYLDFAGEFSGAFPLTLGGLDVGAPWPSSFGGSPGIADCDGSGTPGTMGGSPTFSTPCYPTTLEEGESVLVDFCVGAETLGLSVLKARY
jgi:hypothetical protein